MKKIAYILIALLMATGCEDKPTPDTPVTPPDKPETPVDPPVKEETLAEKIVGEWHCVVSDIDADIYLALMSDSTFELYQKVGEGSHRLYRGSWSMNETSRTLSGRYNDGTEWGSSYETAVSEDKNSMTLVPKAATAKEEHVYRREAVPASVKEGCLVVVKSTRCGMPVL